MCGMGMRKEIQCKHLSEEELLAAVRDFHAGRGDTPDVALGDKYPVKVILCKMARLVEKGVLNYGVSLRTAWEEKREGCHGL